MAEDESPVVNLREFRIKKRPLESISNGSTQVRRRIIQMTSDSDSDTTTTKDNNVITVPEKELQLKYLLATFPNVDSMEIHDVLSRHNFGGDSAASELAKCHAVELPAGGFPRWRVDYLVKDHPVPSMTSLKRKFVLEDHSNNRNKKKHHTKRRKRNDSDDDDDDDHDHDRHGNFKDNRVYDSDDESDAEVSDVLTSDKKQVLEFLQSATVGELQLMSYCSKKKAEAVTEARPFSGWIDLVQKLNANKNLTTDFLNAAQKVLTTRNNIRHLMRKCTNLASQMERAVAAGAGVKYQPRNISPSLRLTNYQMIGLNWLAVLHAQKVNGILADEMGLGKTVQVIAFLAYLKETGRATSTHLVVVPASTLDNWRTEFSRWCPELRVFMYYGSTEERRMFRVDFSKGILTDFDVILTTYTLVGNSPEEKKMFRVTPLHYVIFDEAHMLKNMNTQRYENLARINARNRILLTGTPLQNNLLELMSLLIFVMPRMFAEKADDLKSLFQKNSKTKEGGDDDDGMPTFEREQIEQAKRIMRPFVLRRLKSDVLQDLPKKIDHIVKVPMAPTQKEHYEELVASYKRAANDDDDDDEGAGTTYNGLSIMTDLRKLSNHPLLLRYHYGEEEIEGIAKILAKEPGYKDTVEQYIVHDLLFMSDFEINNLAKFYRALHSYILPNNLICTSGKFLHLDKMLPELLANGHKVLIFSQYVILLDVLEEFVKIRRYKYSRLDGSTPVGERQDLIDKFSNNDDIFLFLLSTKAGGLGINLTAADTVIIHDIDFNPYNDKQAEDRCHRMGQSKTVQVYRLVAQGTIEEGMLEMNKEKLKLERQITTDDGDNPDVKSVVKLLSSALGVDTGKAATFVATTHHQ